MFWKFQGGNDESTILQSPVHQKKPKQKTYPSYIKRQEGTWTVMGSGDQNKRNGQKTLLSELNITMLATK